MATQRLHLGIDPIESGKDALSGRAKKGLDRRLIK
jgi:hypothetical protein